jgi:glutathione S-transferase
MTIEIYWGSGSPFAWRVLLALALKRIPYQSRLLEFSKSQHKAPDYLALNPRGKVPTLKDGDFVLTESLAILAYLERRFPEPPLFGLSPEETGRIWRQVFEWTHYAEPLTARIAAPIFFGTVAQKVADIRDAVAPLHAELATIDRTLRAQSFLAGAAVTAADIAVYPFIELLARAAGKEAAQPLELGLLPLDRIYPAVAQWSARIRALPGYDATYPPHWRAAA